MAARSIFIITLCRNLVIEEAKRHGKALGVEVSQDRDGAVRFSFDGGPMYGLPARFDRCRAAICNDGKGEGSHLRRSIRARISSVTICAASARKTGAAFITNALKNF